VLDLAAASSGGCAVIEALNMLKDVPLKGWTTWKACTWSRKTMRRVFADRAAYLARSGFHECCRGRAHRSVLCKGTPRRRSIAARGLQQNGEAARLMSAEPPPTEIAHQQKLQVSGKSAHHAFFRVDRSGQRRCKHVYPEQQLRLARHSSAGFCSNDEMTISPRDPECRMRCSD